VSLSPTLDATAPETFQENRPTVGFVSLGCPKNLVDSEVMMGLLHRGGAQLTPRAEDADIIVINTCSFIDSAKQESVDTILEMVQHKVANGGRAKKVIVAGCLVERYRDEIMKNIPDVDAVVGTGELEGILQAAERSNPQAFGAPILSCTMQAVAGNIMSGVTVATMMQSISVASMPRRSRQTLTASTARSLVATPFSTMWRSRMPVRSVIHSSLVETIFSRSALVSRRGGT
jgi:hypothetical protein